MLAVLRRMLFVEQRVELALALHSQTDPPRRRTDRMHDDRGRDFPQFAASLEQPEVQVAVFPPSCREALIESANRFENVAATETVRRDELRSFQSRLVALVIRR